MGALAPVTTWNPEDDLLLKNAVEVKVHITHYSCSFIFQAFIKIGLLCCAPSCGMNYVLVFEFLFCSWMTVEVSVSFLFI